MGSRTSRRCTSSTRPSPHDQRRRINRWFTSRRAQTDWQPMVEQLVDELIDGFVGDGRVELMGRVRGAGADPCHRGDPRRRRRRRRTDPGVVRRVRVEHGRRALDHEGWRTKARAHVETQQFFLDQIQAELWRPGTPPTS